MNHADLAIDSISVKGLKKDKARAEKKNNIKELVTICNFLGEALSNKGLYFEAKKEHEEELHLSEALGDSLGAGVACRKIGECYSGLEQFDLALQYQTRHLEAAQSCGSVLEEQRASATIGNTHFMHSEYLRNKREISIALEKAEHFFQKALALCLKLRSEVKATEWMQMRARLYLNLGLVSDARNDRDKCAEYMKRAITLSEQNSLYDDLYRCQLSLATIYQKGGNFSQAQRYYDAAFRCAVKQKDKKLQSDVLTYKAMVYLCVGDTASCKHAMKKVYKMSVGADADKACRMYRKVNKIEETTRQLNLLLETGAEGQFEMYEKLGDYYAELDLFKQSVDNYLLMLRCAERLNKSSEEIIPVYVSLAQSYSDLKDYKNAIINYKKELSCRGDDYDQVCQTWLNIAECQELKGDNYDTISESYMKAYDAASKGKARKSQIRVLKCLIEIQQKWGKEYHKKQTIYKLQKLKDKYGFKSDDDDEEEEEEKEASQALSGETGAEDLSIGELTESGDSEEETPLMPRERGKSKRLASKKNEKGETPLHRACIEGKFERVKKLIQQGHPPNPRDFCGWIPLHEACNYGYTEIVEYLLDHGASVNDRGGSGCEGVTPLMDAANCGHLEVMEVLVRKGANVLAKDDHGRTALDCLLGWRQRDEESLEGPELDQFNAMVAVLRARISADLVDPKRTPNAQTSKGRQASPYESHCHGDVSVGKQGITPTRKDCRRQDPLPLSSDEEQLSDSPYDIEEVLPNPHLNKERTTQGAKAYRSAITLVGSRATGRGETTPLSKPSKNVSATAFVDEEEFIDDDWMIDDLKQPSKRRKLDLDGVFSSTSMRKKKEKNDDEDILQSIKHNRRNTMLESDEEDITTTSDFVAGNQDDIGTLTTGVFSNDADVDGGQGFDWTPENENGNFLITDEIIFNEDNSNSSSIGSSLGHLSETMMPKITRRNKSRQLRLTQCGLSKTDLEIDKASAPVTQTRFGTSFSGSQLGYENLISSSQSDSHHLDEPGPLSIASQLPDSVRPVLRLKVKVQDKLLLIPVPDSSKNIAWLCEEAASRYFALCGLRPFLTLTSAGAVLDGSDVISGFLAPEDELKAVVDRWDLPPIAERYTQACKSLNAVNYRNIRDRLSKSDTDGVLDLTLLSLRPAQLQPIFRSLQFQCSLKTLNLSGNRLGTGALEHLASVCGSLPHLTSLSVANNLIEDTGLGLLVSHLTRTDQDCAGTPLGLTSLDLSFNPLGDKSCPGIISLVNHCPSLRQLVLKSCRLSARFFQDCRVQFENCMRNAALEVLDMSHNALGSLGIELLTKSLKHQSVRRLSLAGNVGPTSSASQALLHLQNYLILPGCALESLDLRQNRLSHEDLDFLLRLIVVGKNLEKINLSDNVKICNEDVTRILELSRGDNCRVDQLNFIGCGVTSPLCTNFLDALADKLACSNPLKCFNFSCEGLEKIDVESLKQVWTSRWQEVSKMEVKNNHVFLGVVDTVLLDS